MNNHQPSTSYYLPKPSYLPIIACLSLLAMAMGGAHWLHGYFYGPWLFLAGFIGLWLLMIAWFTTVIKEGLHHRYPPQTDRTFRMAMKFFIFSEVCFFGAFFFMLFYIRIISVPAIGGEAFSPLTNLLLWPNFSADWPLIHAPNAGLFTLIKQPAQAFGLPLIETLTLISSGITLTIAHHALCKQKRKLLAFFMIITVLLGMAFIMMQAHEYLHGYTHEGLRLTSNIYGSSYYLMTGFHGLHVMIGTIMLIIIMLRCFSGHFTAHQHFAFQGVAWYWHFVDVVWLLLFVFVYWL